jgi:hypothetical protein
MKFPYRVEWYNTLIYTATILSVTGMAAQSQDIQTYTPPRESTKLLHSLPTRAVSVEAESGFPKRAEGRSLGA